MNSGFSPFSIDAKPNHGSPDFARDIMFQKVTNRINGAKLASEKLGIWKEVGKEQLKWSSVQIQNVFCQVINEKNLYDPMEVWWNQVVNIKCMVKYKAPKPGQLPCVMNQSEIMG